MIAELSEQIAQIQNEISGYETQISNLNSELQRLQTIDLPPKNDSPKSKSEAHLQIAAERVRRKPEVDGRKTAIEQLTNELGQLRLKLHSLQQQQAAIVAQERAAAAYKAIEAHVDRIAQASATLEQELLALKQTYDQHNADFRAGQTNPHAGERGYHWQPFDLVRFDSAQVLELQKGSKFYLLTTRQVDLFAPEKQAAEAARQAELRAKDEVSRQRQRSLRIQYLQDELEATERWLAANREPTKEQLQDEQSRLYVGEWNLQQSERDRLISELEKLGVTADDTAAA